MTVLIDRDYLELFQEAAERSEARILSMKKAIENKPQKSAVDYQTLDAIERALNPSEEELAL